MFGRGRNNRKDTDATDADAPAADETPGTNARGRQHGPWDASEITGVVDEPDYVDLGGLIVRGRSGFDLQIATDEGTDQLGAVMFVMPDAAVELRAFAARRSGGLWDEVQAEIVEEVDRLGGAHEEGDGPYGTELHISIPGRTPDGEAATQPSRIVGVEGPRWLLRATFMGRAALEPDEDGLLETALRDVVVVRGDDPMAPRDPIALALPASAVMVDDSGDEVDAGATGPDGAPRTDDPADR